MIRPRRLQPHTRVAEAFPRPEVLEGPPGQRGLRQEPARGVPGKGPHHAAAGSCARRENVARDDRVPRAGSAGRRESAPKGRTNRAPLRPPPRRKPRTVARKRATRAERPRPSLGTGAPLRKERRAKGSVPRARSARIARASARRKARPTRGPQGPRARRGVARRAGTPPSAPKRVDESPRAASRASAKLEGPTTAVPCRGRAIGERSRPASRKGCGSRLSTPRASRPPGNGG